MFRGHMMRLVECGSITASPVPAAHLPLGTLGCMRTPFSLQLEATETISTRGRQSSMSPLQHHFSRLSTTNLHSPPSSPSVRTGAKILEMLEAAALDCEWTSPPVDVVLAVENNLVMDNEGVPQCTQQAPDIAGLQSTLDYGQPTQDDATEVVNHEILLDSSKITVSATRNQNKEIESNAKITKILDVAARSELGRLNHMLMLKELLQMFLLNMR
ncbi:unnamed protein product [Urochloa humidicola]